MTNTNDDKLNSKPSNKMPKNSMTLADRWATDFQNGEIGTVTTFEEYIAEIEAKENKDALDKK